MLDTVVTGGVRPSEFLRIGLVRLGIPTHTVLQFSSSINLFLEKNFQVRWPFVRRIKSNIDSIFYKIYKSRCWHSSAMNVSRCVLYNLPVKDWKN